MEKRINISSKIENLREVERIIDEISGEYKLGSEVYGNIMIAALEAVNNAISHGNKLNPDKDVEIIIKITEGLLKIITRDKGKGFDYANVPDPTAPENIEKVNGRGIFLMKMLSDGLEFHEEGRVSEMNFNI